MSMPRPGGQGAKDRITVPCGQCGACLTNRRHEWTFRLKEEWRNAKNASFVTLTYNDDNIPIHPDVDLPVLDKQDIQDFMKRLRAKQSREKFKTQLMRDEVKTYPPIRYFIVGEYGPETLRPHYHGILFNVFPWYVKDKYRKELEDGTTRVVTELEEIWEKGFVKCGSVTPASIHYCTKYFITKVSDKAEIQILNHYSPQFTLMSRKPGIGYDYVERVGDYHSEEGNIIGVMRDGYVQSMPRYYREKLFTDAEKEQHREMTNEKYLKEWREKYKKYGSEWLKIKIQRMEQTNNAILKKAMKGTSL